MGNKQPKEYLSEYWADKDKPISAKKETARARKLFNYYDTKKTGKLDREQALAYLDDLLTVSGLKTRILSEAPVTANRTPNQYYQDFLNEIFRTLDRNGNNSLEFEELLKPNNGLYEFVEQVSQRINRSTVRSNLVRSANLKKSTDHAEELGVTLVPARVIAKQPAKPAAAPSPSPAPAPAPASAPVSPTPSASPAASVSASAPPSPSPAPAPAPKDQPAPPANVPALCKNNCGFYGNPAMEGYCSQCCKKYKAEKKELGSTDSQKKDLKPKREPEPESEPEPEPEPEEEEPEQVEDEGQEEYNDEFEDDALALGGIKESGNWLLDEPEEENERKFEIMTKSDIEKMQDNIIATVAPQLGVSLADAALILLIFDWDVDKLLSKYFDKQQEYLKDAGVLDVPAKVPPHGPNDQVECLVCFDTVPFSKTYALRCGHQYYCRDCWKNYLQEKTNNAVVMLSTRCIQRGCHVKLNRDDWQALAEAKDFQRYKYFFMKSFVDANKKISFCPNPSCQNAVRYTGFGRPMDVVECTCGFRYCFACGMEYHNPVTCDMVNKWRERNQDDQASIKLVMASSKQCPHCGLPTERNEGCNHMTCRKEVGGCGGEWCWMCRGDWKTHGQHTGGFYSCNKYEKSEAKKLDDMANQLKEEAARYAHYFERHFNHERLKNDAEKKREAMLLKTVEFREKTGMDPKFLLDALELLIQCRHMLKWTYVFGFFLDQKNSAFKQFFEYQQANMEGITERLSDLLWAKEIEADQLKNMIRVCKKYTENLVKSFEEMDSDPARLKQTLKQTLKTSTGATPKWKKSMLPLGRGKK